MYSGSAERAQRRNDRDELPRDAHEPLPSAGQCIRADHPPQRHWRGDRDVSAAADSGAYRERTQREASGLRGEGWQRAGENLHRRAQQTAGHLPHARDRQQRHLSAISVISMGAQSIGTAIAAEKNVGGFFCHAAGVLPYILEMAQKFKTKEDFDRFRADWEMVYSVAAQSADPRKRHQVQADRHQREGLAAARNASVRHP